MRSIHIGAEYHWPKQGIFIINPDNGHGTYGVHFTNGGNLLGFNWQSNVKCGGSMGYEVLAGLFVSPDGVNSYEYLMAAHHMAWADKQVTQRDRVVMFPSSKPYKIPWNWFILLAGQGYPLPMTPIPGEFSAVEYQVTLYVETTGFEVLGQ